jgi:hypothetical protein
MRVVLLDVFLQHRGEVPRSGDQQMIEAFAAQGADQRSAMAFALGARTWVRTMRISAPANTASKSPVNLLSRSRIKNRN